MDLYFYLVPGILGMIWLAVRLAESIPGLWKTTDRFNSTADWTPAARYDQTTEPPAASAGFSMASAALIADFFLRIITSHLETGETLKGFARGFFSPPRPRDWNPTLAKCPLLIAVTSSRMLIFELTARLTVTRSCFIGYDAIQYLSPPKPGFLGTSGRLRLGLSSGLEYQMGFLGPLLNDELMRQEQLLAAYLRHIAPRFPSSRSPHALAPQPTQ